MKVALIVQSGAAPARLRLRLPTVMGRSANADVKIKHHHVSRRHCELVEDRGLLRVRDLDSVNGTLVNGQPIKQDAVLNPGDTLTLGSVSFRVEFEPLSIDRHLESESPDDLGPPAGFDASAFALVSYQESADGSFVGLHFGSTAPEPVDEEVDLNLPLSATNEVSRVDLWLDHPTEAPLEEDRGLDQFLRGLGGE